MYAYLQCCNWITFTDISNFITLVTYGGKLILIAVSIMHTASIKAKITIEYQKSTLNGQ